MIGVSSQPITESFGLNTLTVGDFFPACLGSDEVALLACRQEEKRIRRTEEGGKVLGMLEMN